MAVCFKELPRSSDMLGAAHYEQSSWSEFLTNKSNGFKNS